MTTSCPELATPFADLLCDGSTHAHFPGEIPESLCLWSWGEANRVMIGCSEVQARHDRGHSIYYSDDVDVTTAYPVSEKFDRSQVKPANTTESPVKGADHRAPKKSESACPGCHNFRARDDWTHNREIGQCSYPFDAPIIWDCNACMTGVPRFKAGHTGIPGECKWVDTGTRAGAPRFGAHPRAPRRKASA